MKTAQLKVKVTDVTPESLKELEAHTKGRIKEFIQRTNDKFYPFEEMKRNLKIPSAFFEYRHVCMNCGDVQNMASYAIAQTTQGHKILYTCECKHVTILPQQL